MGGLIIAAAMIPSVLLWARPNVLVLASLWCLVGMGLVGLYDDTRAKQIGRAHV